MKTIRMFRWPLIAVACLLLHQHAGAQGIYTLDWFAIEGGGGECSGGNYTVSGRLGQSESGAKMAGGDFSVTGGFLSIIAVEEPPLRIAFNPDGTITVACPRPSPHCPCSKAPACRQEAG